MDGKHDTHKYNNATKSRQKRPLSLNSDTIEVSSSSSSRFSHNTPSNTSQKASKHVASAKLTLWAQYKQLIPNTKHRALSYRKSNTSDIVRELRRLRKAGYSSSNPFNGGFVASGVHQSLSSSMSSTPVISTSISTSQSSLSTSSSSSSGAPRKGTH